VQKLFNLTQSLLSPLTVVSWALESLLSESLPVLTSRRSSLLPFSSFQVQVLHSGPFSILNWHALYRRSHTTPVLFPLVIFLNRVSDFCLAWPGLDHNPIYASRIARTAGMTPRSAYWLRWGLANFWLRLAWNQDPPHLHLSSAATAPSLTDFAQDEGDLASVFHVWMSHCFSTICWKTAFSPTCLWHVGDRGFEGLFLCFPFHSMGLHTCFSDIAMLVLWLWKSGIVTPPALLFLLRTALAI
jgi:hypothetical protein